MGFIRQGGLSVMHQSTYVRTHEGSARSERLLRKESALMCRVVVIMIICSAACASVLEYAKQTPSSDVLGTNANGAEETLALETNSVINHLWNRTPLRMLHPTLYVLAISQSSTKGSFSSQMPIPTLCRNASNRRTFLKDAPIPRGGIPRLLRSDVKEGEGQSIPPGQSSGSRLHINDIPHVKSTDRSIPSYFACSFSGDGL